jgi:hypothetical protein
MAILMVPSAATRGMATGFRFLPRLLLVPAGVRMRCAAKLGTQCGEFCYR